MTNESRAVIAVSITTLIPVVALIGLGFAIDHISTNTCVAFGFAIGVLSFGCLIITFIYLSSQPQ